MKILYFFLGLFIIAIILVVIISMIEIRKLNIKSYTIQNKKIPKEFNGYKLILMSDLHNCFYNNDRILQIINDEKPNCVVVAGDIMVYGEGSDETNFKSLDLIKDISELSDVYFSPGNHEMGYMLKNNNQWIKYEKYLLDSNNDNIYFLDNKKWK